MADFISLLHPLLSNFWFWFIGFVATVVGALIVEGIANGGDTFVTFSKDMPIGIAAKALLLLLKGGATVYAMAALVFASFIIWCNGLTDVISTAFVIQLTLFLAILLMIVIPSLVGAATKTAHELRDLRCNFQDSASQTSQETITDATEPPKLPDESADSVEITIEIDESSTRTSSVSLIKPPHGEHYLAESDGDMELFPTKPNDSPNFKVVP